ARIAGVTVVELRLTLVAGDGDLLRVHDDDEGAGVDVVGELGLALAAQGVRDPGRQPAEGLALRVDDVPLPLDLARFGAIGLHHTENRRTGRPPRADCTSRQSSADGASSAAPTRSEKRTHQPAGASAIASPPRARAATPTASRANPPIRTSAAPVRPERRALRPRTMTRSTGLVRSASWAVAATNEKLQPSPSAKSVNAIVAT